VILPTNHVQLIEVSRKCCHEMVFGVKDLPDDSTIWFVPSLPEIKGEEEDTKGDRRKTAQKIQHLIFQGGSLLRIKQQTDILLVPVVQDELAQAREGRLVMHHDLGIPCQPDVKKVMTLVVESAMTSGRKDMVSDFAHIS